MLIFIFKVISACLYCVGLQEHKNRFSMTDLFLVVMKSLAEFVLWLRNPLYCSA